MKIQAETAFGTFELFNWILRIINFLVKIYISVNNYVKSLEILIYFKSNVD